MKFRYLKSFEKVNDVREKIQNDFKTSEFWTLQIDSQYEVGVISYLLIQRK